ncbi:MAG: ABC transporter permease [Clostridiales bacterium]|jgi:rhamnose transport system permease protein|nr:ABC transporter permease [Clostridiales bacterium]
MKKSLTRRVSQNAREICLLAVIALIAVLVNVRSGGNFLAPKNISDMLVETSILAVLAMGMMSVIITGGIDLSVGSTMALAGMVGTTVLRDSMTELGQGLHPALVIALAIGVGMAAGLLNGFLVARLNVLPIIATLGTMNIYRGATYLLSGGKWMLQQNMTVDFMAVATGKAFLGVNNLIWIALAVFAINFYFLGYTRTGRRIYAVGNSKESAEVSGINTKAVTILAYVITGGLAGLAGILYVCKYAAAQGETATGYELSVIAACVLGGVSISGGLGKAHGAILGALLFGMLNNALPLLKISPFWQEAIRGLIILISIIVNALVSRRSAFKALERRVAA